MTATITARKGVQSLSDQQLHPPAFNGLQSSAMFKQKMLRATQVPMQEFICDLRFRHLKVWREANFSCPRAVNKKVSQVVWEF